MVARDEEDERKERMRRQAAASKAIQVGFDKFSQACLNGPSTPEKEITAVVVFLAGFDLAARLLEHADDETAAAFRHAAGWMANRSIDDLVKLRAKGGGG